jgi:anti-sigma factor RsiW
MDHRAEDVTEFDLQSYLADQLTAARRIEVEAWLSGKPEAAMQVMADLRIRDELRLALGDAPRRIDSRSADAARRLERGLSRDRFFRRLRGVAAALILVGIGWGSAHLGFGPLGIGKVAASAAPPAYVAEAIRAHRTALLRAGMHSQPVAPNYDPAEIRAATAIGMPALPADWKVADAQIFPSSNGPSVEMAIRGGALGSLSLFAARPGIFDVVPATLVHDGDLNAAYWQRGEVAYALVAAAGSRDLERAAEQLAGSLN